MKRSENRATDDLYLVENIVDRRVRRGRVEYRVRWKGFPPEQDSWEPFTSLREPCLALIQEFHNRKSAHEKRRFSLPIVTSHNKPTDRNFFESYTAVEKDPKLKSETSFTDKTTTSTRGQTQSRALKKFPDQQMPQDSLPNRSIIDSPYSGAISLNSTCLLATSSGNDDTLRLVTSPANNSATDRLSAGSGNVDGLRFTSRSVRDALLDSAVSSVSSTSSTSEKTFRAPSNSSTKRSSSITKRKSETSITSVVSDQSGTLSTGSKTKVISTATKQSNSSAADIYTTNSHSGRGSKAERNSAKEIKPDVSSSVEPHPEPNRKSVTIMLEAPPSQEFHSTKDIQIHQPTVSSSKAPAVKRVTKTSTLPKKVQSKRTADLLNHSNERGKLSASPVPDSDVAKVTDVILQLREARRRPVQSMILSLCSKQYNLSAQEVLAALDYLVYQGQIHEVHFTNGISYRSNPRVVARGDLSYPTNLSAKIKAKYVTGIKKKKASAFGSSQPGAKRSSQAGYDPDTGMKRARPDISSVTSRSSDYNGQGQRPTSSGHSLFGRALKPTAPHGSIPNCISGSRLGIHEGNPDNVDVKYIRELPLNGPTPSYPSQAPHSDRRSWLIPPSSPIRESYFESQFNSLPHRRNGQPPLPNESRPASTSRGYDVSNDTPSNYIKSSTNNNESMNPSSSTPNSLTVPRRSSIRQTEAVYKFKSILVKKNLGGGFTEVWLQSPGSPLKNAFTIQVLEELTAVLNQAVYDTSRLIMISGMGSVFSAGLDLTLLTGPLPNRSCSNSAPKFPCPPSATSSGGGIPTNSNPYHDSTQFQSSDRGVRDQRMTTDSNGSMETMCCCCCSNDSQSTLPLNGQKSAQCQPFMHSHPCCLPPPDPMVSQQLGAALRAFLLALASFPKPVVVGVNGPAMGLAVAMLPLCDLVYVSDAATFQLPYTRLGQTPEGGSSFTLGTLIGLPLANELLLAGRKLSAREAVQRGFVSDLLYPKSFKQELVVRCQKLAATSSMALEMTKCIVRTQHRDRVETVINTECRKLVECWQSPEFRRSAVDFLLTDMGDFL